MGNFGKRLFNERERIQPESLSLLQKGIAVEIGAELDGEAKERDASAAFPVEREREREEPGKMESWVLFVLFVRIRR